MQLALYIFGLTVIHPRVGGPSVSKRISNRTPWARLDDSQTITEAWLTCCIGLNLTLFTGRVLSCVSVMANRWNSFSTPTTLIFEKAYGSEMSLVGTTLSSYNWASMQSVVGIKDRLSAQTISTFRRSDLELMQGRGNAGIRMNPITSRECVMTWRCIYDEEGC